MKTYFEAKQDFEKAEKVHNDAFRRAQWLERRLMAAPTEEDYNRIKAELDRQEEELKGPLALALLRARAEWVEASLRV